MFETHLTVVGRIVTDLRRRIVNNQELISFRVASNSRRRNGEGTWEPGNSLFITVNCWGKLVTGVGAALYKGAPVIVVGDVFTSEYEDKDGLRRSSLEMRATAVGPDLSRAIVRIEQPQPKPAEVVVAEPEAEEPDEAQEAEEATDLAMSA
jgi:single-strand DNA-binding protein